MAMLPSYSILSILALACLITLASTKQYEHYGCVSDCYGLPLGDYQSCQSCSVYVTCVHGFIVDNRPCPDALVWDDWLKMCSQTSSTCTDEPTPGPADPTTEGLEVTTPLQTTDEPTNECVKESGYMYVGHDVASYPTESSWTWETCADMCRMNSECTHWSFTTYWAKNHCLLKNSDSGRRYDGKSISGNHFCGQDSVKPSPGTTYPSTDSLETSTVLQITDEPTTENPGPRFLVVNRHSGMRLATKSDITGYVNELLKQMKSKCGRWCIARLADGRLHGSGYSSSQRIGDIDPKHDEGEEIVWNGELCTSTKTPTYGKATKSDITGYVRGKSYTITPRPVSSIAGLVVKSGDVLDGIGFLYRDNTQQYAGATPTRTIKLSPGDQLTRVSGTWLVSDNWYGSIVSSITFTTLQGKTLGPYGTYRFPSSKTKSFGMDITEWCGLGMTGHVTRRGITISLVSSTTQSA